MLPRKSESWGGGGGRAWEYAYVCAEIKKIMFQFVTWIISKLYVSVGGLLFFKRFLCLLSCSCILVCITFLTFVLPCLISGLLAKGWYTNAHRPTNNKQGKCYRQHNEDIDFLYFSFLVSFVVVFIFQENTRPEWLLTNHNEISSPLFR